MDSHPSYSTLVSLCGDFARQERQSLPCISLEQSSGTYLIRTFRRRYRKKPYRGDGSSYLDIAFRISTIPPFPLPNNAISSRDK